MLPDLAAALGQACRQQLGRSLSIREIDAGSCNVCELEIHALNNPFYDIERFGLRFVASPRHADVLLVTGPVTKNMREALERTYNATPAPKWVVSVGDCAADGGCFAGRSEEHTSELQSLMRISYAVFCLKKKTKKKHIATINQG